MVWHYAVGVDCDVMSERVWAEIVQEPFGAGWVEEDSFSIFAAEGNEKPYRAHIAIKW